MTVGRSGPAVGIYAWTRELADSTGGIESYAGALAYELHRRGYRVVLHCLAAERAGWHVRDGEFRIGARVSEPLPGLVEFRPAHGPGLAGAVAENDTVAREFGETVALVMGTRDEYVFDIGRRVARGRGMTLVTYIHHAAEERWFRGQFATRLGPVLGPADADELRAFDAAAGDVHMRAAADADLVVVPTNYVRAQLGAALDPPEMTRTVVAFAGPDPEVFTPRSEPWTPDGPWVHAGRAGMPNAWYKNFLWSCELLREVMRSGDGFAKHARLVVCGAGNGGDLVREFARQNDLADRVDVPGALGQQAIAAQFREASYLLAPSPMEAGSKVIVEAVMSGCLPLVVDHAGSGEVMSGLDLDEFLLPGRTRRLRIGSGDAELRLVEPDVGAAIDLLRRCADAPAHVQSKLSTAAHRARTRFSLASTTDRVLRAIRHHTGALTTP